jgi:hypothetical protein
MRRRVVAWVDTVIDAARDEIRGTPVEGSVEKSAASQKPSRRFDRKKGT